jgi:pilus assembly protein CpaB
VSSRRTLILVGAILIGVIAALLIYNYVQGINNRANNDAKLVTVYVAKSDVKKGTTGEAATGSKAIDTAQIPQQFKPATAITTTDQLSKKVALFDIPKNSVIVTDMFVDPATAQISFRDRITNKGWVAVSITADSVHEVGGFLVAGDEVNITVPLGPVNPAAASATGWRPANLPNVLFQKVFILAVGDQPALQPGETVSTAATTTGGASGTLTLEVPPAAALYLEAANDTGGIYLSLVTKDYVPQVITPLPTNGLIPTLPGQDPGQLTPYGPSGTAGPKQGQ